MKKLGLIGGTGPESTLIYYRRLHTSVQKEAGETVIPPMTIENLSAFTVFELLGGEGGTDKLHDYLLEGVNNLAAAGAEVAALSANTTHIVIDRLRETSPLPLISSIDSTRRAVAEAGVQSVALLGTEFTMVNDFLSGPLRADGVHVAIPTMEEVDYIQEKIATELELGIVREETREAFLGIINRLIADDGVNLIILACTELPLLFPEGTLPVPGLDTIDPHIEDLTRAILDS